MHSNIGYMFTLCLNLSILLPLADHPLVNNYTLVLYVYSSRMSVTLSGHCLTVVSADSG